MIVITLFMNLAFHLLSFIYPAEALGFETALLMWNLFAVCDTFNLLPPHPDSCT